MRLVVASASPRRRALIADLGYPVEYGEADVLEVAWPGERPEATAVRLACKKARAVAHTLSTPLSPSAHREAEAKDVTPCPPSSSLRSGQAPVGKGDDGGEPLALARVVVGGDTVVVSNGRILGKPADRAEARGMLRELRAREHRVITGVCLLDLASGDWHSEVVTTRVWMRDYSDAEVERYVLGGGPLDKAGAYGIQDADFRPVSRIEGCYLNVVGLPLCAVARSLRALGHKVPAYPTDDCRCSEWAESLHPSPLRREGAG